MRFSATTLALVSASLATSVSSSSAPSSTSAPGYFTGFTTEPANNFTFGKHYAVLNLDLINGLVGTVNTTTAGQTWIKSTASWIDAVHAQKPVPLSIFSRIYFSTTRRPEIGPDTPIAPALASLGNAVSTSPQSQIYPAFHVKADYDVVVQKSRYYSGFGNQLEEILRAQQIDTVVISGIRTSGVVLSTVYRLFDIDYKVFVIGDNCIETPPDTVGIDKAIKAGVIPKLPASVITLEQAIAALKRSGPAVY